MKTGLLFALAAVASNEGVLAARLGEIVKSKLTTADFSKTGGLAVPKVAGKGDVCDWVLGSWIVCGAGLECKPIQVYSGNGDKEYKFCAPLEEASH